MLHKVLEHFKVRSMQKNNLKILLGYSEAREKAKEPEYEVVHVGHEVFRVRKSKY